jgi:hypothetical protein
MVTADQFTAPFDDFVASEAKAVSAPPDAATGFIDRDGIAEFFQFIGGAETGETCDNDDDASVRRVAKGSALKWREVFQQSFSLCIERSMTRLAVGWCPFAFVLRDGRGMTVLSAEDGI